MGRCGCEGTTCGCRVIGSGAATVTGSGTASTPYNVNVVLSMLALSTGSIGLQLLGSGSQADPWILTGDFQGVLNDLLDVDTSGGTTGYVLAQMGDGSFALVPPATAAVGAVATGNGLDGDGSSGDPLNVRLGTNSGLSIVGSGLVNDPFIVTSEANLDAEWGSVPEGTFVSTADGSGVWVKTTSGWRTIAEDTGTITTLSGNVTAASGWTMDSMWVRRRNGIVQFTLLLHPNSTLDTAVASGNLGNVNVANLVPAKFRPVFYSGLGAASIWGPLVGAGIGPTGNIDIGALTGPDGSIPAGGQISLMGTWIGA